MIYRPLLVLFILLFGTLGTFAVCSDREGPLVSMIPAGKEDAAKTPLILIHGHEGVPDDADINADAHYWDALLAAFENDKQAAARFTPYLFQYCSDREPVSVLAERLRDLIDDRLPDRSHVIVAHSMGGIIATAYMAETVHRSGQWKGKKGGDTTLGLITLATPHHGTPAANDTETMSKFVPASLNAAYDALHRIYWRSGPAATAANRSDLRWDNFDRKLSISSTDINTALARRNAAFAPYSSKLIAYSGIVSPTLSSFELAAMLLDLKFGSGSDNRHRMLALANVGLVNALGKRFGDADGMVPISSSLFCVAGTVSKSVKKDLVCTTLSRVRRFEAGSESEVRTADLPDNSTLSITRRPHGFDHLDMLVDPLVIDHVLKDMLGSFSTQPVKAKPQKPERKRII
ncbi:MAG: alpha/beta fold hydrolase [Chloracidobacterium sp.]|nr:alpha/beta fold hydrolase [Chloracidobacterium sp.]MCO5332675.1 alpha/beta fold hydrolase [Pyrinomonadaceae bacterium]